MKKQDYHTIEDLLQTASFRQWVLQEPGADVQFWENWLGQNPDKKDLVVRAGTILKGLPFEFREQTMARGSLQAEWEKLQRAAFTGASPRPAGTLRPIRRLRPGLWYAVAGVAVIALAVFLLQQYILNPILTHQTPYGQQRRIILSDSTAVELNANSRLTYRKQNPRKIWLDGEAFFQVKKKPATGAHFQVITNDLTIEVLGTAFNVVEKAYRTEVILEEGSVKLKPINTQSEETGVYMAPGEMATFSAKTSKSVEKRQVEAQVLTSWKAGVLQFEDAPLSQVMERIEEIYGWRAVYQDESMQTRNISMPLPSNDLESALRLLEKAINISIDQVAEDQVLLLY